MAQPVIHVENVGKKYILAHRQQNQNPTLKDALSAAVRVVLEKVRSPQHMAGLYSTREEFWALKDVSLEALQGERVGIIGRNGAGKSTLLKILSRITEPTTGRIHIKGRVASLLEVGTGFHPELTGRENIFLNGAVLGMSKAEVRKKFDEIVAFAEVEKFLDTPVKRYSSGMYVRLAFAVAAHLEPEILIVDEVLAVGDLAFQRKCLGKMEHVANEGRTLLFVSHNMSSILSLTQRCLRFESGRIVTAGPSADVVREYIRQVEAAGERSGKIVLTSLARDENIVGKKARYEWIRLLNSKGEETPVLSEREPFVVELCFRVYEPLRHVQLGCTVKTLEDEIKLFTVPSPEFSSHFRPGLYSVQLRCDPNYLRPGDYVLMLRLFGDAMRQDHLSEAAFLNIHPAASDQDGNLPHQRWIKGYLQFDYSWSEPQVVQPIGSALHT